MLTNGEMEAPFVNGLAQGWVPNCYGSNKVVFARESADVHGGESAQRVTCARFDDGGVQFHSGDIAIQKGKPYTLRLWLKGDVTAPVYVGIGKHGAPYTPYLKRGILLPNLHEGYVARIVPSSGIWLDDVQVEEGGQTDYQPAQPLEVGAETPTRWCRVGDAVEVTAWAAAGTQPDAVALKYTLEDLWPRRLTNLVHQVKPG